MACVHTAGCFIDSVVIADAEYKVNTHHLLVTQEEEVVHLSRHVQRHYGHRQGAPPQTGSSTNSSIGKVNTVLLVIYKLRSSLKDLQRQIFNSLCTTTTRTGIE